jgi:uncharacterized membrane protein YphA (DoxX/SURF4 family)
MLNTKSLHNPRVAAWMLRLGLAFVFAYAGVSSLRQPLEWIGYLPSFLATMSNAETLIKVFAVGELALVLWLLVGKYVHYCAALCALTMIAIVAAGPGNLIITFRDVGLALMAVALVFVA